MTAFGFGVLPGAQPCASKLAPATEARGGQMDPKRRRAGWNAPTLESLTETPQQPLAFTS